MHRLLKRSYHQTRHYRFHDKKAIAARHAEQGNNERHAELVSASRHPTSFLHKKS